MKTKNLLLNVITILGLATVTLAQVSPTCSISASSTTICSGSSVNLEFQSNLPTSDTIIKPGSRTIPIVGSTFEYSGSAPASGWSTISGGWNTGSLPFVGVNTGSIPNSTFWPIGSTYYLRKTIDLTGYNLATIQYFVAVDNGFSLYVNGTLVSSNTEAGPAIEWEYTGAIPSNLLVNGVNYIAYVISDDGAGAAVFNSMVTGQRYNPSYSWLPGGATTPIITVNPTQTTSFTCAVTINAQSCSSSQTIEVLQPSTGIETVTECSSFSWTTNNQTYTQSGQYTAVLTNAVGCDSIVTLNLTITQPTSGSETRTECSSFTWSANNQTYTQSGQYTAVLTNSVGCDSSAILNLTITQPSIGSETITECNSFTWAANGQTYNQTGQYTALLTNGVGCDSTVTLTLNIESVDITTQPVNQIVVVGNNAQFIVVTSTPNTTYQWQIDNGIGWVNLSNAGQYSATTTNTLTISNATMSNNNLTLRCIITSGACSVTSNVAVLTVNNNVGINEISQDNLFTVFPNPAQSIINVKADNKLIGEVYSISDNAGRIVLTGKINSQNTNIELDNLSDGIFIFSIGENMKQTFKLIKE